MNTSGSFSWVCYQCGCPNFDSSLFGTRSIELSNPFSTLSDSIIDIPGGDYPKTSTPTDTNHEQQFRSFSPPKNRSNKIKTMIINCNGLKGQKKQAAFRASVDHHNPDIILGCESKISQDMATYSIFPDNYAIYRKDRDSNGGGVFIAVRDTLITADIPDLDSNCEVVWASLQFSDTKSLYIASYYGPQTNKAKSLEELAKSLSTVYSKQRSKLPNVIIGGDFNFADINWDSWTTTNPKTASEHRSFLSFLLENSLSQLVTKVTRPISNSILDLITTTNPHLVSNIIVSSGISDHDIVTFDINMKPKYQVKPPRKMYNFLKADESVLNEKVAAFTQEFLASNPSLNTVDTNWEKIRNCLYEIMNDHVPWKMSNGKRHLPWITRDIKRCMRKRDTLYSKARKHPSDQSWRTFRQYRNKVTSLVHNAHQEYVNNIIGANIVEKPKSFWSYVKLMRTENLGVPTLRTDTKLCTTDKDKAEALNTHFKSVFTCEPKTNIPDKGISPHPSISVLTIGLEEWKTTFITEPNQGLWTR
ncbi:uncharacterized protein [Amphiura filiformis]|uniref:uncharacterized protein n=1 Tax=Amphiura filiformis TaxID=82378 RepID=UPI003B213808